MSHRPQATALLVLIAALLLLLTGGIDGGVMSNRGMAPQQALPPGGRWFHNTATEATVGKQLPEQPSMTGANSMSTNGMPPMLRPGLSAWGLITVIVFVILVGMAAYYGVMCYPVLCSKKDGHYLNTMREASSTSSNAPLGDNYDEKNYSSRSTTPSKSHE